jgi:hypothetical protein
LYISTFKIPNLVILANIQGDGTWNASTGQNRDTFQRPHRRRTSAPLGPRTGGPAGSLAGLTDPVLLSLIGPWPGMDPTGPLIRQCQVCPSVGREDPHGPEMKSLYLELDSWLFWWRLVRRRIFFDAAYFKLERELGQCHTWAQNGLYRRRRGVHPWSVPDTSPDTSPDPGARIELHYNDRLFPRIHKLSRSRCTPPPGRSVICTLVHHFQIPWVRSSFYSV